MNVVTIVLMSCCGISLFRSTLFQIIVNNNVISISLFQQLRIVMVVATTAFVCFVNDADAWVPVVMVRWGQIYRKVGDSIRVHWSIPNRNCRVANWCGYCYHKYVYIDNQTSFTASSSLHRLYRDVWVKPAVRYDSLFRRHRYRHHSPK